MNLTLAVLLNVLLGRLVTHAAGLTCDCESKDPHCNPGHWRLILAGSRFTKDAERNYAPIEGEALAMAYGLECTKMYCMGNNACLIAESMLSSLRTCC